MSAILNGHWRPVTQQNPCPACGKPDWCAFSADGAVLRCMRDGSAPGGMQLLRHDGSGGTLFKINKAPVQNGAARYTRKNSKSAKTSPETKSVNLDELANRFAASLTPRHRTDLTVALGVPESTLDALACGWCDVDDLRMMGAGGAGWSDDPPAGAYSFPERAGDGRLVGFSLRTLDGRKGSPSRSIGASRGLVIPKELQDAPGPVIIVEGASDVAAALALGLVAVGRPSNVGGAADLGVAHHAGARIGGGERLAVVEFHPGAQRERVGQAVGGDVDALGELRLRVGRLVAGIQRFVHVHVHVARRRRRGRLRVPDRRRRRQRARSP